MFHKKDSQILKQGPLTKRAIGKSILTGPLNFKSRWIVLTEKNISYSEIVDEGKGREKGVLELSRVKGIEVVDYEAFGRENCFQIIFDDFNFYLVAESDELQKEWISFLRDAISGKDNSLFEKFHSGVYINNSWTCCKSNVKKSSGCKESFYTQQKNQSQSNIPARPIPKENFKVTAKYDFHPTQTNDLALIRDEEYTILDSSQDSWWYARDALGREGYIPCNYVVRHTGIENEKWYRGDMTRQEADKALRIQNDGTFVVRNSSQAGMYTLSFCFQKVVKHYHIRIDRENQYYVSQNHHFDSVAKLIEYHKLNSAGLVTRLRVPYSGSEAPPVMLGYGVFQINRNELLIKREIGTGQFGTVHEATWRGEKRVAIKKMKPDSMCVHDFIEEAKMMQRFRHKNLVSIHGVCSEMEPLFIVVEYMCHGSLLNYLRSNRTLMQKTDTLLDIVFQVACAMKYLEHEKFIHRDLAARNCLVGENNIIKVGDFGLARYVLDDQYTASEGTKFPVKWAAPEVIDYTKFSSKSDVWAFGILCWEVFSGGRSPYSSFTNPQVAEEVRKGYRLERPINCLPEIYHDIMLKCWEQLPENRPAFKVIYQTLQIFTEDYADT